MNYFELINKIDGLRKGLCFLAVFLLVACSDFHGPWEYYPEERETYVELQINTLSFQQSDIIEISSDNTTEFSP